MPRSEPTIILHGGFHKTGTTHLQRILKRNQTYLARQGVTYIHHRDTRKGLTVPVQLNGYYHLGVPRRRKVDDGALREMTRKFFASEIAEGTKRLLISDENLPGHCGQCVRGGELYSLRREFCSIFSREMPAPVSELHVSVRGQADFFAAAYVEFLRSLKRDSKQQQFVTEDRMKSDVLAKMPSWSDAINDIADAFPGAQIFLWRFEDFRELNDRVLGNLCGAAVDVSRLKRPSDGKTRPTASGRAVGRMLQIEQRKGMAALVDNRIRLQEAFPAGRKWPRYDPWTPQERAILDAQYKADWARLVANSRYNFLLPQTAKAVDTLPV